jgi:hypothetical protein
VFFPWIIGVAKVVVDARPDWPARSTVRIPTIGVAQTKPRR